MKEVFRSYIVNYVKKNPRIFWELFSFFDKDVHKDMFSYPSHINTGYRHIQRSIDLIRNYRLSESDMIIDVGAASGITAMKYAEAFPQANIICFEPIHSNFGALKKNVSSYGNIVLHNCGLGEAEAELAINKSERITSSSILPIAEDISNEFFRANLQKKSEESIKIRKLDNVIGPQKVNLIKIDVQGYELKVLQGATEVLKRTALVLLEMQNHDFYVNAPMYHHLDEYLREQGFMLADIIPSLRDEKKLYEWDAVYVNKSIRH